MLCLSFTKLCKQLYGTLALSSSSIYRDWRDIVFEYIKIAQYPL